MAVMVEFAPEVETRLEEVAHARGVEPAELVRRLVEESLPDPQDVAMIALFAAWEAEDATDDPTELAARQAEWEELRAALEANPVQMRVPQL